jgi:imidazolonepropionase
MLPAEAINAATTNAAYALNLENEVGSITVGKRANLIVTRKIPSIDYLPYSFGTNNIDKIMVSGEWVS